MRWGLPTSSSRAVIEPATVNNTARLAMSTIGSFMGKNGVLETAAREIMRVSAGIAPGLSRAVVSRYLAR